MAFLKSEDHFSLAAIRPRIPNRAETGVAGEIGCGQSTLANDFSCWDSCE
jgi:ABC-type bacteriocin/lantibiotic exporter with double-glycine peptidase domain